MATLIDRLGHVIPRLFNAPERNVPYRVNGIREQAQPLQKIELQILWAFIYTYHQLIKYL